MTNAQLLKIYQSNIETSVIAALRAVWNAGWYEGAGVTPTATSPDRSLAVAAPTAILKTKHTEG